VSQAMAERGEGRDLGLAVAMLCSFVQHWTKRPFFLRRYRVWLLKRRFRTN